MGIKTEPIFDMKKICTKNRLTGYCFGGAFIVVGILILIIFGILKSDLSGSHLTFLFIIAAVLCEYPGLLLIYISYRKNLFYMNIFKEHLSGKGLVNGKKVTFCLLHSSITSMRIVSGKSFFIDTPHCTYEIPVPPEYFFALLSDALI